MVTKELKLAVISRLIEQEKNSGLSAAKFSHKIGINQAQWSRLKKGIETGDIDNIVADGKFISLAREYSVSASKAHEWVTVQTATFEYINALLDACQRQSISALLVDMADLGKTHVCKWYSRNNRNVVYIDCSQVKSRQLLVREIARNFGVIHTGRYADVYADLIYMLNSSERPLIILDEAGDLKYDAFLECKALWNATENNVGWLMTGADGLRKKIKNSMELQKVGFAEIFRRYGSQYRKVTPTEKDALTQFRFDQVAQVAQANAPEGTDIQKLVQASRLSLTNLYNQIQVLKSRVA